MAFLQFTSFWVYIILFREQHHRGSGLGVGSSRSGILILSPFQNTKALGKDGILVCHEETLMHHHAERADLFLRNFTKPEERIDSILMREKEKQLEVIRHVLRQIVRAVEFFGKASIVVSRI